MTRNPPFILGRVKQLHLVNYNLNCEITCIHFFGVKNYLYTLIPKPIYPRMPINLFVLYGPKRLLLGHPASNQRQYH